MGSLPSLICRHLCYHQAGIIALVAIVLPSLMHRQLHSPGVFGVIAITLLPLLQWCCCHPQAGCCPHHNGGVAIVDAQVSLLLSWWHCHPCCTSAIANNAQALLPLLHQRHLPYHADLFALMLHGRCHHHCTGIVAPIMLACLCHCAGVVVLVTLVLSTLVRLH